VAETVVLLGATVAVAILQLDFSFYVWAYALSYGFTVVYAATIAVVSFGHRFRFDFDLARVLEMGRESLPFALTFVIGTLYYRINGLLLNTMAPARNKVAVVGLFGAAYKFLDAATFIPQALMDPVYPALSRLVGTEERLKSATVKAYKMLAVAAIPVAIVLVVLAEPIVVYATGPGFAGAVPILRVLALSVMFLFVNNTFIYTLNAMGRQRESTRLAVQSLVVNVVLNVLLIPQQNSFYGGAMGAAWATVLTEIVLFAGGWYLLRRHLFALPFISSLKGVLPAGGLCAVVMGGIVLAMGPHLHVYVLALLAGLGAYVAGLFGTHAFTIEELAVGREALKSLARR
jgi:O-antigen/teichoic acid export membrane protein